MSFALFDLDFDAIEAIRSRELRPIEKIREISTLLGAECLPNYLTTFIENFSPNGDDSLAVHIPTDISGYVDKEGEINKDSITRKKGFIGRSQTAKFPLAIHHVVIFYNESGRARVFYKYSGNVRFLKTVVSRS